MNRNKKDLFLLSIKWAPFPAVVYDNIEESFIKNNHFESIFNDSATTELQKIIYHGLSYNHPAIFPFEYEDKSYFVVTIVVNKTEKNEVLAFVLNNDMAINFSPPVLKEEAFHNINNPLAIITLTIQMALKKEIMDQQMIDDLLNKLSNSYERIQKFVEDSLSKA